MSKGMSLAAGGLVLALVVAGALMLGKDGSEDAGGGATLSTSQGQADALPRFGDPAGAAAIDGSKALEAAPLAAIDGAPGVAAAESKPSATPTGAAVTLTGRVVDESGRPVPDARVSFIADPFRSLFTRGGRPDSAPVADTSPHVQTGRDGRFSLAGTLPPAPEERDGLPVPEAAPQLVVQQDVFATLVHPCESLAAPGADVGDLQLASGAWISGRVVDESGRAIAGARARARNADDGRRNRNMFSFFGGTAETLDAVTTGADGRFRVSGLQPGKADLTVSADGRRLAEMQDLDLPAHQPKDVGDVALALGQSIAGVVLDSEGHGVTGAEISVSSMARLMVNRLEDLPRAQIGQEFGQRALTGSDGRFEISGLAGGQYTVHVNADGFDRLSKEDVPAGTRDLRLVPLRLGGLFVHVESQGDGKPVNGARLRATPVEEQQMFMRPDDSSLTVLAGQAALDAAGQKGDPAGAYFVQHAGLRGTKLVVGADGFATKELDGPAVDSRAIGNVSVQLVPESVVAGKVLRPDGKPVQGARVTLAVPTPDDGNNGFRFGPGGRGGRRMSRSITVGGPAQPAETLDAGHLGTQTAADGSFELRGAAPGDWELSATHPDYVDSTPQPLKLAAGEQQKNLAVTLAPAGLVTGNVVEADGTPSADVGITVTPAAARAPKSGDDDVTAKLGRMLQIDDGTGRHFARTGSDGSYKVAGLAEGEYDVALGSGSARGRSFGGGAMVFAVAGAGGDSSPVPPQVVKVVPGQEVRADFVRPRRGTISGRVIAGGRAVPDQPVTMRKSTDGDFAFPGFGGEEARTDDHGVFNFADVEAGAYDLSTHVPGSALERKVTVKLEPGDARSADLVFGGATISGRVVDKEHDSAAAGVNVTLVPVKAEADSGATPQRRMSFAFVTADSGGGGMSIDVGGGPTQQIRTDPDGHFELKWVEAGKYKLEASGGGYTRAEADPFDVTDGQDKDDLVVKVSRGAIVQGTVVSGATGEHLDSVPVRIEGGDSRQMTVTQNGSFKFEGLAAGSYTVTVLGSGFGGDFGSGSALATEKVDLEGGEVKNLDLKTKSGT